MLTVAGDASNQGDRAHLVIGDSNAGDRDSRNLKSGFGGSYSTRYQRESVNLLRFSGHGAAVLTRRGTGPAAERTVKRAGLRVAARSFQAPSQESVRLDTVEFLKSVEFFYSRAWMA